MASKGTLTIRLVGDASDFQRKFSNAEAKLDQVAGKMRSIGTGLTAGVTAPLVALSGVAFNAASDLEESVTAVNQIFGDSADEIHAWSQTTAAGLGIARDEALGAAAGFGNFLQTTGLAQEESAGMSQSIIKLAADMASFNNEDPSAMLERLRSGLAGEAEPLRRFGVLISAARVEAKALELGLADANGEISEGAKVQARYALIMEDTVRQQGDFTRTSEGAANQQRIAAAQFRDTAAAIGEQLLPFGTKLLNLINEWLVRFRELSPTTQNIIVVVAGLAAVLGPLLVVVGMLIPAFTAIAGVIAAVSAPVVLVIAGIAALVAGLIYAYNTSETFREIVNFAFKAVGDFASTTLARIREAVEVAFNAIKWIAETVMAAFRGDWSEVWTRIKELAARALTAIVATVTRKLNEVAGWFRGLPSRIIGALGNLDGMLRGAGRRIIGGLVSGIYDKIGAVKDAMASVTSKVRGFLPFSPAKEGPLSGSGSPEIAGAKIVDMVAGGMRSSVARLGSVSMQVAAAASPAPARTAPAVREAPAQASNPFNVTQNFYGSDPNMAKDSEVSLKKLAYLGAY